MSDDATGNPSMGNGSETPPFAENTTPPPTYPPSSVTTPTPPTLPPAPTHYTAGGDFGLYEELSYANPVSRLAGFWVRVAYSLIDGIIVSLLLTPILIIAGIPFFKDLSELSQESTTTSTQLPPSFGFFFLIVMLTSWIVPTLYILLLLGFTGSTLGQKILGVYVISETDYNSVKGKWGTVILRTLMFVVLGSVPIVSLLDPLWCIWDEKKQTLHDKVANTLVVYKT